MIAFENGHLDLVKTLIEAGAYSINQRDKVGEYTMLLYSITVFILSLIFSKHTIITGS